MQVLTLKKKKKNLCELAFILSEIISSLALLRGYSDLKFKNKNINFVFLAYFQRLTFEEYVYMKIFLNLNYFQ